MAIEIEERESTNSLIASLDRLQQMSLKARTNVLGEKFYEDIRQFYDLSYLRAVQSPSFRPNVMVPELQQIMIQEANDLLDNNPRIYISMAGAGNDEKLKERLARTQRGIQAQWEIGFFNLQILLAQIWALFAGNGYVEVWHDPDAQGGRGEVKLMSRDPQSVYVDPNATGDDDAYFIMVEDPMYLDEIENRWPERGHMVRPSQITQVTRQSGISSLDFTPGPMRSTGDLIMKQPGGFESQVTVRKTWIRDTTREAADPKEKAPPGLPKMKYRLKYPNGRLIVDAGGVILYDGNNIVPSGEFPITRLCGLPPVTGYYAPPPINYSRDLQKLAEKFLSRTYENAMRVNNVVTFVYKGSGVDYSKYGGLPGELHQINMNAKKPEVLAPPAYPDSIVKMPHTLLELQRMIQGQTPSRQGNPGAGNISASLFEGAVSQAQGMTRLRGKLLGPAITRIARIVLAYMNEFYKEKNNHEFDVMNGETVETIKWEGLSGMPYRVSVDPGSIRPMSQTAIRQLAPKLYELHAIDQKSLLDIMDWPDREGTMERMAKAAQEAALMNAEKDAARHGGKK